MQQDISGQWTFSEDFGFGKDKGFARLMQEGERICGIVEFTEYIEGDTPFTVRQEVEGSFDGVNLIMQSINCQILESAEPLVYHPDRWEGILNSQGQLVGCSDDGEGTYGVFLMQPIQK